MTGLVWFTTFWGVSRDRVLITDDDLGTTASFLREYLGGDYELPANYLPHDNRTAILARALSLAIVVTYARPFTQRLDGHGKPEPKGALDALTLDLPHGALHKRMLDDRNTAFAHSDVRPRQPQFTGGLTVSRDATPPLERREAGQLLENIQHMRLRLYALVHAAIDAGASTPQ